MSDFHPPQTNICSFGIGYLVRLAIVSAMAAGSIAWADTTAALQALQQPGSVVLFRHALAPGGGDPEGFVAGDCATQRNLSAGGQEQARRMGKSLRQHGVVVGEVWHSEWCRTRDTAQLAFPAMRAGTLLPQPAFNSFFGRPGSEPLHTSAARKLLLGWRGPGTLVVITHQVNITALTGVVPQSGEGVVLQNKNGALLVRGNLLP